MPNNLIEFLNNHLILNPPINWLITSLFILLIIYFAKFLLKKAIIVKLHSITLYQISDSSIDYKLIYYVKCNQYLKYLATREQFLLQLIAAFQEAKIDFPFPTRTIHLEK